MELAAVITALVVGVVAIDRIAPYLRVPPPILLIVVGAAVAVPPVVPAITVPPELVLVAFLPPLLFTAALRTSTLELRRLARAVGSLAVGLVAFTAFAVGTVLHALLPEIPFAVAFAIGAVVAPPDAVATTAVARRTGLSRSLVSVLEGESLFNDAVALTMLRVGSVAAVAGSVTAGEVATDLGLAVAGGLAVGALGFPLAALLTRVGGPVPVTALTLAVPTGSYVGAEALGGSGVIAVVVTGLILGRSVAVRVEPSTRFTVTTFWSIVSFVLEGVVFALIGLQLPGVLTGASESAGTLLIASAAALGVVVVARPVWIFGSLLLARVLPVVDLRTPDSRSAVVVSWAGMRGVVSLAAAQSLPLEVPYRDLALFVATVVILGSLAQGLTLPAVIRRTGVRSTDDVRDALAAAHAQEPATEAALRHLDELDGDLLPEVAERLRAELRLRSARAWERAHEAGADVPEQHAPQGPERQRHRRVNRSYTQVRSELVRIERESLIAARDEGRLSDEALRESQAELDLEETLNERRALGPSEGPELGREI